MKNAMTPDYQEFPLPPLPENLRRDAQDRLMPLLNSQDGTWGEKLAVAYDFVDRFKLFLADKATCSKGCSHCCHMDVQITSIEAEMISLPLRIPMQAGRAITTGHTSPCPFLSDAGACSVYELRPMACRMFHAFSNPKNCMPGGRQAMYGHPPNYGNDIWKNLMMWLHMNTLQMGGAIRDIRDFFPRAH